MDNNWWVFQVYYYIRIWVIIQSIGWAAYLIGKGVYMIFKGAKFSDREGSIPESERH